MGKNKRARANLQNKKKSKNLKLPNCKRQRQVIFDKLQELMSHANHSLTDLNRAVPSSSGNVAQTLSSGKRSQVMQTDSDDFGRNNAYDETVPAFAGRCGDELKFVQAIICLKSATASVSEISVEQLQRILDKQWNAYDAAGNVPGVSNQSRDVASHEAIRQSIAEDEQRNEILDFASTDDSNELLVNETLTPERHTSCTNGQSKRRRDSLSTSCIIPESDECSSSLSDMFDSFCTSSTNGLENQNKFQLDESLTRHPLTHLASKSYIDQTNEGMTDERDVYFIKEKCANASLAGNQSIESMLYLDYSGESLISIADRCDDFTDEFSLAFNCSSNSLVITQEDTISHIRNVTNCQNSTDHSQIDQIHLISTNNARNDNFEFEIDDIHSDTWTNAAYENPQNDSAYSTSNTDAINYKIRERCTGDKCMPSADDETQLRSKLRSRKKKTIVQTNVTDSPSIIQRPKTQKSKRQSPCSLSKERKSRRLTEGRAKNVGGTMLSADWLNFILESLNVDQVIVESLKVILRSLCDERTASNYVTRKCWKDTVEEQAVNAALAVSDILTIEKKPNICAREITRAIIESLHEVVMCVRLNQTSTWICRVQIIFELCNSLSICVGVIDNLIGELKSFESALINAKQIQENTHAMINRLNLLFYALSIAVQKYRIIVPKDHGSRSTKTTIPHITDLWKRCYVDNEKLKYESLNLDITETQWLNALENFRKASINNNSVQFAENSLSLFHLLASQ